MAMIVVVKQETRHRTFAPPSTTLQDTVATLVSDIYSVFEGPTVQFKMTQQHFCATNVKTLSRHARYPASSDILSSLSGTIDFNTV